MRVWAFPSFYPLDRPGFRWTGIFAHRQYKGLIEKGADLQVILPVPWNPPFPLSEIDPQWKRLQKTNYPLKRVYDGITVHHPRIQNLRPGRLMKKPYLDRYHDAVASVFKSEGITVSPQTDIFYSQWLPESVSVQYAAHKMGLKSAILYIGDDVVVWPRANQVNYKAFENLLVNADMRFACAAYLGKEANKILGKDLPFEVVRWGVDYQFLKPATEAKKAEMRAKYNFPKDKILILNVGSAIVRKGWLDLLDALKTVKAQTDNFVLVGVHAGETEINLDQAAQERGLQANFMNLGEVPPERLNEIFNAVDIFCLPSHWEGLANANIEAMSSGLPVITTDVCGHPELVHHNVNGILVPAKQPAILAGELLKLITDKGLRETLSKNGREFITKEWGNFADNASLLYQRLCKV